MEKPCCHSSNTDWLPEGEGPVEVEQAHDEENPPEDDHPDQQHHHHHQQQ